MGIIWDNIFELKRSIDNKPGTRLVVTSGGFDPLHYGHLKCIRDSFNICEANRLVVIVNSDEFLVRKKGYVFMPLKERMEIIAGLRWVTDVVSWDDGSQFVAGALEILRPDFFTKGGDRTPENMAEIEKLACEKIGCKILYGVGGNDKCRSSSDLVRAAAQAV